MDDDLGNNGKGTPKIVMFDDDEPDDNLAERKPRKPYNPYDLTLDYYKRKICSI